MGKDLMRSTKDEKAFSVIKKVHFFYLDVQNIRKQLKEQREEKAVKLQKFKG